MTFSKMGKPELAIPDLTMVLKLNPDHVNAAFARAACYNSMGLLNQAIEDYNFALFKDQTLNSPVRDETSTTENAQANSTRSRTWSAASSVLEAPFTPKSGRSDNLSVPFSPAGSIAGSDYSSGPLLSSNSKRLDVDATGLFSLYGVASPTIGSNRHTLRASTPSSDVFYSDGGFRGESPRPGSALSSASMLGSSSSSSSVNLQLSRGASNSSAAAAASSTSTFKSLTQFRAQQSKDDDSQAGTSQADKHHAAAYELRKQGNYAAAVDEYSKALQYDPQHFKSLFNRGFAYDKLGHFPAAIQDYTQAIDINPDYAFCFYNRGISYDHLGDLKAALQDFSRAIAMQPNNADFYHNRAYVYRKLQQWDEAIDDYTAILRFAPQNFKALFNRSLCFERKEQWKEALDDVDVALQLQPQHGGCYAHRGLLYEKIDQLDKAINDFTSALMHGAQAFPTLSSRARLYSKLGKNELAISDLSTCLEIQPNDLPSLFSRATCFKALQLLTEAVQDFARVIALLQEAAQHPNEPAQHAVLISQQVLAFNQRGYCYRKLSLVQEAIHDYSQAIALAPDQVRAYNNRGFLYAKCNRFEEAIADYTKAIQLDPLNAYAYHNRGISYDKLGLIDQAIADFGRVFELDNRQSLLANSGGNMSAMMSMVVQPTSSSMVSGDMSTNSSVAEPSMALPAYRGRTAAASSQPMALTLSTPKEAISPRGPAVPTSTTASLSSPPPSATTNLTVVNGNAPNNPLTKLTLRQQAQARSRTPTSLPSAASSSSGGAPSEVAMDSTTAKLPLPPALSRPAAGDSNGRPTINTTGLSVSFAADVVSPPSGKRPAMVNFADAPSAAVASSSSAPPSSTMTSTVGGNLRLRPSLSDTAVHRPDEADDRRSPISAPPTTTISAAAIDEKLDTVAALLSTFGSNSAGIGSSSGSGGGPGSGESGSAKGLTAIRPGGRLSLVATPTPVTAAVVDESEGSRTDDAGYSPKGGLSQGVAAAQKFGVRLRSTTPTSTAGAASSATAAPATTSTGGPVAVRPRFFREPVPVAAASSSSIEENTAATATTQDTSLPPSVAGPLNAATFLAKLRESRQDEAALATGGAGGRIAPPSLRPTTGGATSSSPTSFPSGSSTGQSTSQRPSFGDILGPANVTRPSPGRFSQHS